MSALLTLFSNRRLLNNSLKLDWIFLIFVDVVKVALKRPPALVGGRLNVNFSKAI